MPIKIPLFSQRLTNKAALPSDFGVGLLSWLSPQLRSATYNQGQFALISPEPSKFHLVQVQRPLYSRC